MKALLFMLIISLNFNTYADKLDDKILSYFHKGKLIKDKAVVFKEINQWIEGER